MKIRQSENLKTKMRSVTPYLDLVMPDMRDEEDKETFSSKNRGACCYEGQAGKRGVLDEGLLTGLGVLRLCFGFLSGEDGKRG
ncbi:hypothetical protein AMTR_s00136p00019290 [Amborella trichopoda]|uniref:Uncharacterized protein n=1 Tax=Amborella trichopoda TaxID=13333 RepID=W1NEW3_AMBTC|nr:hypothetical protein AMTR_s00136p00019290 [Amborella trichopoda]